MLEIFNTLNKNKAIKTEIINDSKKALNYARKITGKNDLVVAAGSIYLVGEIIPQPI